MRTPYGQSAYSLMVWTSALAAAVFSGYVRM